MASVSQRQLPLKGNLTLIGTQWGDEGKGKVVDWLSPQFDAVVRFQGGNNAGHTVITQGKKYVLSLLPSAVTRKNKTIVIGRGVVIDPLAFAQEVTRLKQQGLDISPKNLLVADAASLVLSLHRRLDALKAQDTIGTTGKGIGPAYEDKIGRRAIKVADLHHLEELTDHLTQLVDYHKAQFEALDEPAPTLKDLQAELKQAARILLPYSGSDWQKILSLKQKRVLFEGAQGAMLDIGYGTYPFVTSSHTMPAYAALGSGGCDCGKVLGISKAYATRVGNGHFPTEDTTELGIALGKRGNEFGAVTGRKRRCGWLDLVMLRQVIKGGGVDWLALTKLDVLDKLPAIKVCTAYKYKGKTIDYLPTSRFAQQKLTPVYEELAGWQQPLDKIASVGDLPPAAKAYIRRIEEFCGIKTAIISVGPSRHQTFLTYSP